MQKALKPILIGTIGLMALTGCKQKDNNDLNKEIIKKIDEEDHREDKKEEVEEVEKSKPEINIENKTAEEYAKAYVEKQISNFSDVEVCDSKIEKFEKVADFNKMSSHGFEIYLLKYSLQFTKDQDLEKYDGFIGNKGTDNWLMDINGNNYMVFQVTDSNRIYIDTVFQGEFDSNIDDIQKENNLREILERKGIIPKETYASDHYVAIYRDFIGRTNKVLLSQNNRNGFWLVERWMDEHGNIYYEPEPDIDKGGNWRKDPEKVAIDFIDSKTTTKLPKDKIQIEKLISLDDFYELPESIYRGYIEEVKTEQANIGDLIHVTLVEWLTIEDKERAKALGIDINTDMPSGFYMNKTKILETFFLNDDTKYYIGDYALSSQSDSSVSKKVFIDYINKNRNLLFEIHTIDGKAVKIQEVYIP